MKSLRLQTYNVWFDQFHFDERGKEIRNIILKEDADIVCLQV